MQLVQMKKNKELSGDGKKIGVDPKLEKEILLKIEDMVDILKLRARTKS